MAKKNWKVTNKKRLKKYRQAYYQINKEKERRKHLQETYGITPEDYEEMLLVANNRCQLCGGKQQANQRLSVDHCHASGKVRGLLCHKCNAGLGMLQDNPVLLRKAADYIEERSGGSGGS